MFEESSVASRLFGLSKCLGDGHRISIPPYTGDHVIYLDLVSPADEPFLYKTFASTRSAEMALTGWNAGQQEAFLRMQYEAQRRSYLMQLPQAKYWVVRCNETAVGRLILDRTPEEIHIVDIAILPEFRSERTGSALMQAILKEASDTAQFVRLHVERFNPALQWYERLGFHAISEGPIYFEMVWRGDSSRSPNLKIEDLFEATRTLA